MKRNFIQISIMAATLLAGTAVLAQEGRLPVQSDEGQEVSKTRNDNLVPSKPARVVQPVGRYASPSVASGFTGGTDMLVNNNNGVQVGGRYTQSETTILAFGNRLVIGYNDAGSRTSGDHFTGWSWSSDGGATFTDGGTLPNSALGDAGDPVLARNEASGRIYLATLAWNAPSTIQVFHSDDNGESWSAPVNGTPGGAEEDKEWIAVDNFAGPGNGNVYLISRRFTGVGGGIYFFRSTDNGATFTPNAGVLIVPETINVQGAFVAVGPDHSVYAFWYSGTSLFVRRSADGGLTFGPTNLIVNNIVGGVNGNMSLTGSRQGLPAPSIFRTNAFPHVAINPVSGDLYLTYATNPVGTDKADIFLVQSSNQGLTWSAPARVNDDATTTDQWEPTIAVTPDGTKVGVFYYSRQEDAGNNLYRYYGRIATVAGPVLTFQTSFAISDVASLPEFGRDFNVNAVYMGDYNHASATNTAFHVSWADNRDNLAGDAVRKDPNVYYDQIVVGCLPYTCTVTATPSNNIYTGGVPTNIYLGYGPQSVTLGVTAPAAGEPYTYSWTGNGTLSDATSANPVFSPTAPGTYVFTVVITNNAGCTSTCSITICVRDIRVPGTNGKKVYLCHAPPDNPANYHTLAISVNAVSTHMTDHPGDRLGSCDMAPCAPAPRMGQPVTQRLPMEGFRAFPNPSRGTFNLQLDLLGRSEIRVLNQEGVVVERKFVDVTAKGQILTFNMKSKASGMYYVQVISSEGVQTSKLVLQY